MLRTALQRVACATSSAAACTPSGSLEALASRMGPAARPCWTLYQQRHFSSDDSEEKREISDPLVLELADRITQLNLLQVSDLTEILKQRLGIQDSPMMGMPMMGMPMGGPAAAAPGEPAAAAAPAEEKTEFTLKLDGFDAAAKIKVIKEVRAITGLGLKEAKELVSRVHSAASLRPPLLFVAGAIIPLGEVPERSLYRPPISCHRCLFSRCGWASSARARTSTLGPSALHHSRWRVRQRL